MRNAFAIFKKECYLYLVSPTAWIVASIHLLLTGYFFYNIVLVFNEMCRRFAGVPEARERLNLAEMVNRPLVMNMAVVLLLIAPLLTMRLYAEERRSGTLELLFTSPVTPGQIVAGKYLASLLFYTLMLATTLVCPLIMKTLGAIEPGAILAAWFGLWLTGAAFLAAGNFASTLTDNQMVAGVLTTGLLLFFWLLGWTGNVVEGPLAEFAAAACAAPHLTNLAKGLVDLRDVTYFVSFAALFTALARLSLGSLRWRL